jgi:hypothetical protein
MKYLNKYMGLSDADSGDEAATPEAALEYRLAESERGIAELPAGYDPRAKAELQLQMAQTLGELGRGAEAWDAAREAFDTLVAGEHWEEAVIACDIMFEAGQEGSLAALGQGIWLAVTFPIDPELTVAMLHHVIEETPDDSDGAAVAAVVASYVASMRAEGRQRDDLLFFTNNMLGTVARRHSNVEGQEDFEAWVKRLELDDPEKFLPRMRNVVDVLVQDDWWVDRDSIWERLATSH